MALLFLVFFTLLLVGTTIVSVVLTIRHILSEIP
jgi:hypothetical protein